MLFCLMIVFLGLDFKTDLFNTLRPDISFRFSKQCNGCIERDPVHPGTELGVSSEFGVCFPQLNGYLLKKIIMRMRVIGVHPTYFMHDVLMLLQIGYEFMF